LPVGICHQKLRVTVAAFWGELMPTASESKKEKSIQLRSWLMAFRPKTLTAALVPIVVGTALVDSMGFEVHWRLSIFALLASFFIQVGTNLVNDAMDFKKGADTKERIGPQRVTQSGIFQWQTVMIVASLFFMLAAFMGLPLVMAGGYPILAIGLLSILCGYAYTSGPFPLAYRGMGDLFVILFFGLIAVMGLFYLHTEQWLLEPAIAGLQVGLHATVLIAINNLRDAEGDKKVNKRTLAVRFGETFAKIEIMALIILPFFLSTYWWYRESFFAFALSLLPLPLGWKLARLILMTPPSEKYNKYLGMGAGLHLIFGLMLALGLVIDHLQRI
jgi:1,4-dihydroxy-2-naphthoate polyprenyltransferase